MKDTSKVTFRLPKEVHMSIVKGAKECGQSQNTYLTELLLHKTQNVTFPIAALQKHLAQLYIVSQTADDVAIRKFAQEEADALWQILKSYMQATQP